VRSCKSAHQSSCLPVWALSTLVRLPGGTARSNIASKPMNLTASCPGTSNQGPARTGRDSDMFRLSNRFAITARRSESGGHWPRVSRKAILPRALQMAVASAEYSSSSARCLAVQGISRICEQAGSAGSTVSGHIVTGPTVCTVTSTDWSASSGTSFTIKVQLLCLWPETQALGGSAGCCPSITRRLRNAPTRDHVFSCCRGANVSSRLAFAASCAALAVPRQLGRPNVPLYTPPQDSRGRDASRNDFSVLGKWCLPSAASDRASDPPQSGSRTDCEPPKLRLLHHPKCLRPAWLDVRNVAGRGQ
jgi:hypothetical protein